MSPVASDGHGNEGDARSARLQAFLAARAAAPVPAAVVSIASDLLAEAEARGGAVPLFGMVYDEDGSACVVVDAVGRDAGGSPATRVGTAHGDDSGERSLPAGPVVVDLAGGTASVTLDGRPARLLVHDARRFHARVEDIGTLFGELFGRLAYRPLSLEDCPACAGRGDALERKG